MKALTVANSLRFGEALLSKPATLEMPAIFAERRGRPGLLQSSGAERSSWTFAVINLFNGPSLILDLAFNVLLWSISNNNKKQACKDVSSNLEA
ncbi:hypothetical protein DY000_02015247 [Brassica cretica]|uniref:Uncharacterized protein n=1 Tax=Brassica cretica TaxID=69181 RepID=A0ABQ7CSH9_BRACR|nr:hypothetical protein DY000_02015247 [Brassica cretica]